MLPIAHYCLSLSTHEQILCNKNPSKNRRVFEFINGDGTADLNWRPLDPQLCVLPVFYQRGNNYFFKIPNSFMLSFIFSNEASILSSIPTDKRIIPLLNPISICSSSLISEEVLLPGKLNKVLK